MGRVRLVRGVLLVFGSGVFDAKDRKRYGYKAHKVGRGDQDFSPGEWLNPSILLISKIGHGD
jgi:hypothetical protein